MSWEDMTTRTELGEKQKWKTAKVERDGGSEREGERKREIRKMRKVDGEGEEKGRGRREVTLFYFIFLAGAKTRDTDKNQGRPTQREERETIWKDRSEDRERFHSRSSYFHFILCSHSGRSGLFCLIQHGI